VKSYAGWDCHTHWGIVWKERDGVDPTTWLAVLDSHGLRHALVLPHEGLQTQEAILRDNDAVREVCARSGGRMIPAFTCHPAQRGEAVREVRRCAAPGVPAALKFHPWLQGFSLADPAFVPIVEAAEELGLPVIFHDGTPTYSLPEQVIGLAIRHPRARFVLGHAGLLWNWRAALLAATVENVWVTLCGPHLAAFRELGRRIRPERLLWGSDFGFGFADPIGYRLGLLREAGFGEALLERILDLNPKELFRAPTAGGAA